MASALGTKLPPPPPFATRPGAQDDQALSAGERIREEDPAAQHSVDCR